MQPPISTRKKLVYDYEGYPLKTPFEIDVPKSPREQILEYLAYKEILTEELKAKIEGIYQNTLAQTPTKKERIYHYEGYPLKTPLEVDVRKSKKEQILELLEENGVLTEELRLKIEKIYLNTLS